MYGLVICINIMSFIYIYIYIYIYISPTLAGWGVMVKASSTSSHVIAFTFGQVVLGKVKPHPYSPRYGLTSTTAVLIQGSLWH